MKRYLTECLQCAQHASAQRSQLLQLIVTCLSFQMLTMNFIEPLRLTAGGNLFILHIMNYFSQFSITYLSPSSNTVNVTKALSDLIYRFTRSTVIYCDCSQHFENQILKQFLVKEEITLKLRLSDSFKSFDLIKREN